MGAGIIQIANIGVYILLARWLTIEDYASYRQLFLISFLISGITFSALPTALMYFCGREDGEGSKSVIIREHVNITLFLGGFAILALLLCADYISIAMSNPALSSIIIYFCVFPACYMIYSLVAPMMVALEKTKYLIYFSVFIALVNSLPVLFIASQGFQLKAIVSAATVSAFAGAVVSLILVYKFTNRANESNYKLSKKTIYQYAWPLLAATAVGLIGMKMDHLLVSNKMGPEVYAIYAVGAFEIPIFSLLQGGVSSALLSQFASNAAKKRWDLIENLWRDAFWANSCLIFPLSAGLAIFSEEFIIFLFSDKYAGSAIIFSIYILMAPLRVMSFGLVMRAIGKNKRELFGNILYLMLITVLVYSAVTFFEIEMVAVAFVVATFLLTIYLSYATYQTTMGKINIFKIYPKKSLFIFILMLGFFYILRLTINLFMLNNISILIIMTAFIALITAMMLKLNHAGLLYERTNKKDNS